MMKFFQSFKYLSYLLLLAVWIVAWKFTDNPLLVPSPTAVAAALYAYALEDKFQVSLLNTLSNLLFAWSIIQVFLFLFLVLQFNHSVRRVLADWATLFQPLPTFALLPVLIVLLGLNSITLFVLIVFSNLWSGMSYLLSAVEREQKNWQHHADNFKWNLIQQIKYIYLYALLPHLVSIAAVTWGLTWRTLLAVEVTMGGVGDNQGLGIIMTEDRMTYDIAEIWAVLLIILIISAIIQYMFEKVKSKVHW